MDRVIKQYLAEIGKRGGSVTSDAKARSSRINGNLGGRPRKEKTFRELSAYDAMKEVKLNEDWRVSFFNFVDGFRRRPSHLLVKKDPKKLSPNPKMYALLQSICIQVCLDHGLKIKGWLTKQAFLQEPWFVSGIKSLYAIALRDATLAFRKNNIYVLDNFMSRV